MDIEILAFLAEHRLPFFDTFFSAITYLGSEIAVIGIICLIYWCLNKRLGCRLLLSMFSGLMLNQLLKVVFCVQRPFVRSERVKPLENALPDATGYSFPSGHTANSTALYGIVATEKKKYFWLFWLAPLVIGFSRLYVGVHTPQDVLVSLVLGVGLVYLSRALEEKLYERPALDLPIAAVSILLSVLVALYAALKSYPEGHDASKNIDCIKMCGACVGLFIGWVIERRSVCFSDKATVLQKVLRLVIGFAIVLVLMKALKSPFNALMGETVGSFARYLLIGLFATYVWPLTFTRLHF